MKTAPKKLSGSFEVELTDSTIGARVRGLDTRNLSAEDVAALRQLIYERKYVCLTDQDLGTEEYIAFARHFGSLEPYHQKHYHHPDHPEIFVSSNVQEDGKKIGVAGTGQFWHTDYSFFDQPLSFTMVFPQIIPEGDRDTRFIDLELVLDRLPAELEPLTRTRAFHDAADYYKIQPWDIDRAIIDLVREFREHAPGAWHPTVLEHPVTGKRSLYVSEGFTRQLEGFSLEEGSVALEKLFQFTERPEHITVHEWHQGDLLFWDNRALNHQASKTAPGQSSCSYRISLFDGLPFYVGHSPAR